MSSTGPGPCPLCNESLADAQSLFVCGRCHESLSSPVSVHTTGEFPAVSQLAAAPADFAPARTQRPKSPTVPGDVLCSMCGKPGDEVKKILTQSGVRICNECVALCADVLAAELGEDWK